MSAGDLCLSLEVGEGFAMARVASAKHCTAPPMWISQVGRISHDLLKPEHRRRKCQPQANGTLNPKPLTVPATLRRRHS